MTGVFLFAAGCASRESGSPQPAPADRLQKDLGGSWVVDTNARTGVPDLLAPTDDDPTVWQKPGMTGEQAARAFIQQYKDVWQINDVSAELATRTTAVDEDGMTHVIFDQLSGGVPVFGAGLRVHFGGDGTMGYVNGDFFPNLSALQHSPARDQAAAIAAAIKDAGPDFVQGHTAPTATLCFDGYNAGGAPRLVWHVVIAGTTAAGAVERKVIVDAQTGAALMRISLLFHVAATGEGSDGVTRTFEVTENADKKSWTMTWPGSGSESSVQTNRLEPDGVTRVLVTSTDLSSWDPLAAGTLGHGAAVDVHANAHLVDQFYRTKEHRSSYDGKASPFVLTVHDSLGSPVNAYWSGTTNDMHYGDGSSATNAITSLDVTGHEITHGFTQYTSNLSYHAQPGALNESISDIFGELVEHQYKPGPGNFLVGEGIFKSGVAFRDFQHPSAYSQPDHMKNLVATESDSGGVHMNSGIPNNAFYLMVMGGANDTSGVTVSKPLDWDGARRIWWHSECYGLSAESDFSAAARAQIASAKKIHVSREGVACAWLATGVVDAEYVAKYKVTCGDAPDAGDAAAPLKDSCAGRADGVYCSELVNFSAIVCKDGSIAAGLQCAGNAKCAGPNGPGTAIQCR